MTRLMSAMRTDVIVQIRNNLYAIGIGVGVFVAVVLSQFMGINQIPNAVPVVVLLIAGGSTLLYVAGMILFEKDEGTINAISVTPLRTSEYLWSKIITLTTLGTLESLIIVGGAMLIINFQKEVVEIPNIPVLLLGIIAMCVMYTLMGIVMIVRFKQITDFLVPLVAIALVLQLPLLYFLELIQHPILLIIPTSAQTMLMQGAFVPLTTMEWLYSVGYSSVLIVGLTIWAYRAFHAHIILKVG